MRFLDSLGIVDTACEVMKNTVHNNFPFEKWERIPWDEKGHLWPDGLLTITSFCCLVDYTRDCLEIKDRSHGIQTKKQNSTVQSYVYVAVAYIADIYDERNWKRSHGHLKHPWAPSDLLLVDFCFNDIA